MAEAAPRPSAPRLSAWAGLASPGRLGRRDGEPGIVASLRDGLGLATVTLASGHDPTSLAMTFPDPCRVAELDDLALLWTGPRQWLAVSPSRAGVEGLADRLEAPAAIVDQSDSRAVLSLTGPMARVVLAKGCPLDLHPRAFAPGSTASTAIEHVPALIWLSSVGGFLPIAFHVAVGRSMADAFWSWLAASAAEFGLRVEGEGLADG